MEGQFLRRIQKPKWLHGITKKVFNRDAALFF